MQRENLALLVATMLNERSANLMSLAAALLHPADRIDMRYQWIMRVLVNPPIECDAVMHFQDCLNSIKQLDAKAR